MKTLLIIALLVISSAANSTTFTLIRGITTLPDGTVFDSVSNNTMSISGTMTVLDNRVTMTSTACAKTCIDVEPQIYDILSATNTIVVLRNINTGIVLSLPIFVKDTIIVIWPSLFGFGAVEEWSSQEQVSNTQQESREIPEDMTVMQLDEKPKTLKEAIEILLLDGEPTNVKEAIDILEENNQ